jgi:hypothetical protein
MPTLRSRLPLLAAFALLLPLSPSVSAQRPTWTPIAELLVGSIGEADPVRMSNVLSRCTALNILFAGLASDSSDELSEGYQHQAHLMIQHAVLIESNMEKQRTGADADIASLSTMIIARVDGMVDGYDHWLDANLSTGGSYINQDIKLELDSCRLASQLVGQLLE